MADKNCQENLKARETVTKKDVSQIYGISDNTTYETMKAAHIDTKATTYKVSEIFDAWVTARQMLSDGKSYADVDAHFTQLEQQQPEIGEPSLEDAVGALQVGIYDQAKEIVGDTMKAIAPYLPALVLHGLASLYDSKQSVAAMNKARTEFIKSDQPTSILDRHVKGRSLKSRLSQQTLAGDENKALPQAADESTNS